MCSMIKHKVIYWTNILNDPFTETSQETIKLSKEDCFEMEQTKSCQIGKLYGEEDGTMSTGNKLEYKHSYWSIGKNMAETVNCILKKVPVITQPGKEKIYTPIDDINHCSYSDGSCRLGNEAIIVWKVKNGETNIDEKRCLFKKFTYRNGTIYKNGWLSDPPDLALTFNKPEYINTCGKNFVVSQQGYAIEERVFQNINRLLSSRVKREIKEKPLDGEVRTSQLEAQLQARAIFADKEMQRALQAYSKSICDYISSATISITETNTNPTLLIRKLSNSELLEGEWVAKDIIEFWPCSLISDYQFISSKECYKEPKMNITITREFQSISMHINPLTLIVNKNSEKTSCETNQFTSILIEGKLIKINQLTGESSPIKEIEQLDIQSKFWSPQTFETELQIFRKLIVTNLSEPQIEMMKIFKAYKTNTHIFGKLESKNSFLGGGLKVETPSILQMIIGTIDGWKVLTRIVVIIIISKWIYQIYDKVMSFKVRKLVKKQIERKIVKSECPQTPKIEFELEEIPVEVEERIGEIKKENFRNLRRSIKRGRRGY
uniref:Glycoprotein n=1 Tax=Meloidogyne incognita TaxID=6306 RepID=A0A914KSG7_MELIC